MTWLPRALIGPGLWAVGFALVYGLHGLGCAQGWSTQEVAGMTLHRLAMVGAWVGTLLACVLALMWLPSGPDPTRELPRIGALIGLGATIFTLLPLLVATSC